MNASSDHYIPSPRLAEALVRQRLGELDLHFTSLHLAHRSTCLPPAYNIAWDFIVQWSGQDRFGTHEGTVRYRDGKWCATIFSGYNDFDDQYKAGINFHERATQLHTRRRP